MNLNPKSRRRHLPIARLIPNLITVGALCCGMSAMRFAMNERWEMAATFLIIAAFLDGIDGRVARMLKATSNFGAQIDSLSDIVCFGVAPAIVLHLWALQEIRGLGWAVALFYTVCCALRLARFNTSLMEEQAQPWQKKFFTGVPAPAGAMLAMLPLILTLTSGEEVLPLEKQWLVLFYLPCVALLMASRLPTFMVKGHSIPTAYVLPVMLSAIALVLGLVIEPWWVISALSGLYLCSLPISAFRAYRYSKN